MISKTLGLCIALVSSADANWANHGTWSGPFNTDIWGTGMDQGTVKTYLSQCQSHCEYTTGCQTAQFSTWQKYNGRNCFIYNNQLDNDDVGAAISGFQIYKYTRSITPTCNGQWCGPYYKDIYGTGVDGGSYQWDETSCKARCRANSDCKAAQYSDDEKYNGFNCFLYDSQNANRAQLGNFKVWYYNGHSSSWGTGEARDIAGIGMGGSWASSLDNCKRRCSESSGCEAAQFSATGSFQGHNCYIYSNQWDNQRQFQNFVLYKFDRAGCNGAWGCFGSRLFATHNGKWVDDGKDDQATMGSIGNLAFPALLSISAVLAMVGVVRFARSQRPIALAAEDQDTEALFVETEENVE